MSDDFTRKIPEAVASWVGAYDGTGETSVERFLQERISPEAAATILDVTDGIRARFDEVRDARESGKSPQRWLGEQLGAVQDQLVEVPVLSDVQGLVPTELASQVLDLGQAGLAIGADGLLAASGAVEVTATVAAYFGSDLNSPAERSLVALASGAIHQLAEERKVELPLEVVVGLVDGALFTAKIAAKVAQGVLPDIDAWELLEDRVAATVAAFVGRTTARAVTAGSTALGTIIGAYLGNPQVGTAVGKAAGRLVGEALAPRIAEGARRVVKAVSSTLRSGVAKLGAWVFG